MITRTYPAQLISRPTELETRPRRFCPTRLPTLLSTALVPPDMPPRMRPVNWRQWGTQISGITPRESLIGLQPDYQQRVDITIKLRLRRAAGREGNQNAISRKVSGRL